MLAQVCADEVLARMEGGSSELRLWKQINLRMAQIGCLGVRCFPCLAAMSREKNSCRQPQPRGSGSGESTSCMKLTPIDEMHGDGFLEER
jgi:hypothetical protein